MSFRLSHRIVLGSASLAALCLGTVAATENSPDDDANRVAPLPPALNRPVAFEKEVLPLLKQRCFACHSGTQLKGGLRLDRREALLQGGDSGAALKPGESAQSLLVHFVAGVEPGKVMPPAGKRLSPAEIGVLRAWIDQGAPWSTSGGQETARTDKPASTHWAFLAPSRPAIPKVHGRAWIKNPIDAFVLARLEKEGIRPSPYADRPTLIRRLSLDLTGLVPTPAEVDAFVADRSPDAYEKVVDRLLASPHFGERWGRHWLDLARYADSDGYEKDLPRPYAYLYRDWVIQAFNRDMPFDQFTIEQLAGDLLPHATLEQKIATGFHRNTLKNREGGVDPEEDRVKNTVDRVSTTGTAWLGLTVACAECHTHKFDPITQREFYGMYAFFNSVEEVDLPVPNPSAPPQAADAGAKKTPAKPARVAMTLAERPEPRPTNIHIRGDFLRKGAAVEPHTFAVLPALSTSATAATGSRPTRLDLARWLVSEENPLTARVAVNRVWQHLFGRGIVATPNDFGTRGERPSHPELLDYLAVLFTSPSSSHRAGTVTTLQGSRGHGAGSPGTLVTAAGSGLQGSQYALRNASLRARAGTRYGLRQESRPTENGLAWSTKRLIKLIVMSATYQQSSRSRPDLEERDPKNILLARQSRFRVEAEVVRDLYLAASGLLNREIGGPSIRPPLPADIAALGYANSVRWAESKGTERYKRGMYIFYQRTVPYPMLSTFDAPDSNAACTRRERSNTPLQALTLLNDPVFIETAQALARRVLVEGPADAAGRADYAFRLCIGRRPSAREASRLLGLYTEMRESFRKAPEAAGKFAGVDPKSPHDPVERAAWTAVARIVLNLDEFVTRE